jgi:glutamate--cysteine ligase
MIAWAHELLESMTGICEILDGDDATRPYTAALAIQRAKLTDVARTPSARLLAELRQTGESFFELALRMSSEHKRYFLDLYTPNDARLGEFTRAAAESLEAQREVERSSRGSFDDYLKAYFAP